MFFFPHQRFISQIIYIYVYQRVEADEEEQEDNKEEADQKEIAGMDDRLR